jgi:UDP-N-acetylglucosamine transferase subunit ALG13
MPAVTAPPVPGTREARGTRVLVTVGTDHYPFNRLIGWINDWLAQHPEQAADFFVQRGTASVVAACPEQQFLDADELGALLDEAAVVVCHGGPGSIADAWARGVAPIVVPRLRRLGEVVDDHQLDFCRKLAELGRVRLAEVPADLVALLTEVTRDHQRFRVSGPAADVDAAVRRFAILVDELVGRPRRRRPLARWVRRARPGPGTDAVRPPAADGLSPELIPAARSDPGEGSSAGASFGGMPHEEQG